jgi:hypothetical protein
MLKIVKQQRKTRLAIICDYCQNEINSELGIYAWRIRRDNLEIADGMVYTLHKGICEHATTDSDNRHQKSLYEWLWSELADLPGELINNLGITWERAQGKLELITVENIERLQADNEEIERQVQEWEGSANPDTWDEEG